MNHDGKKQQAEFENVTITNINSTNVTAEKEGTVIFRDEPNLEGKMKPRHLQMISISGSFGTGLVIGTGQSLLHGGPGSQLVAYIVMGGNVYNVMTALAEMATYAPMDQGFPGYATRYADPALGFATGYNYWCKYIVVLANNLTASGLIIQYWRADLNVGIWITVFAIPVIIINVFGESQFLAGWIKLFVMTMLIIVCLVRSLSNIDGQGRIGFRYWQDPGAFAEYLEPGALGRFLGFWAAFTQSAFAYVGCEVVGATFGEADNLKKEVPKAIKWTFYRIVVFYIFGVFVLGMAIPYTDDMLLGASHRRTSASASPFVIAIKRAGISVLPDITNGSLLVFVLSAASSDIYVSARTLYALAKRSQAPKIFRRTVHTVIRKEHEKSTFRHRLWSWSFGVPMPAVLFCSLFFLLGYLNVSKSSATVFGYFVSLVTVFGALNWISILISYVNFSRGLAAQGIRRSELPYRGPLQPYAAYYSLGVTSAVILFNGFDAFIHKFDTSRFVTSYIGIVIYLANYLGWKFFKKTRWVKPALMDLESNNNREAANGSGAV